MRTTICDKLTAGAKRGLFDYVAIDHHKMGVVFMNSFIGTIATMERERVVPFEVTIDLKEVLSLARNFYTNRIQTEPSPIYNVQDATAELINGMDVETALTNFVKKEEHCTEDPAKEDVVRSTIVFRDPGKERRPQPNHKYAYDFIISLEFKKIGEDVVVSVETDYNLEDRSPNSLPAQVIKLFIFVADQFCERIVLDVADQYMDTSIEALKTAIGSVYMGAFNNALNSGKDGAELITLVDGSKLASVETVSIQMSYDEAEKKDVFDKISADLCAEDGAIYRFSFTKYEGSTEVYYSDVDNDEWVDYNGEATDTLEDIRKGVWPIAESLCDGVMKEMRSTLNEMGIQVNQKKGEDHAETGNTEQ